jgi:hypothetical protein
MHDTTSVEECIPLTELCSCIQHLSTKLFPRHFPEDEPSRGFGAYRQAWREEKQLLEDELVIGFGGKNLSRLPNLSLIEICASDGTDSADDDTSYLPGIVDD